MTQTINAIFNDAYLHAFESQKRYLILYGGAGSGKSYAAAQKKVMRTLDVANEKMLVIRKVNRTCAASTVALCKQVLKDWSIRYEYTKEMHTFNFANGSSMLHMGIDDPEKIKSIQGVTSIWIEEATELREADFMQLDLRLRGATPSYKQIILTFNPINRLHWLHDHFFVEQDHANVDIIHTTYKDNFLIDDDYKNTLNRLTDELHRMIYLRGEWGSSVEGLIFTNWQLVDKVPKIDDIAFGMDFGFNNPTTLIKVSRRDKKTIFVEQIIYQTKLTTAEIIELMNELDVDKRANIWCDHEPDRIKELRAAGFNAKKANKSVLDGISSVKQHDLQIKDDAVDLIRELQLYKWATRADDKIVDLPVKEYDHACDALRYAIHSQFGRSVRKKKLVL